MKQYSFTFNSVEEAMSDVNRISDTLEKCLGKTPLGQGDAAAFIFASAVSADEMNSLLTLWDANLSPIKRVGVLEGYSVGQSQNAVIKFSLIVADNDCFYPVQIPAEPGEEQNASEKMNRFLGSLENVKAVALYPSNRRLNITRFLRSIDYDIPVFGAGAVPQYTSISYSAADELEEGYGIGEHLLFSGFTALVIAGPAVHAQLDYILGWEPIGREMDIVLEENDTIGETKIKYIDEKPAVDIYGKYLGVEWDENFIMNVCEFPLMVRRNGVNLCSVPMDSKDEGLTLAGTVEEGEKLRFSYSTREAILGASQEGSKRMAAFRPDAVVMSLCGNRINFLRQDAHLEWEYYSRSNPALVYCHGYCEIAYQNGKGGVLNSAIVVLGIREYCGHVDCTTSLIASSEGKTSEYEKTGGQIPLSYRISRFFSIMTEELVHLQHNLEDEVEKKTRENESLSFHVVQTLAEAIDAKDKYTHGHSGRVARYAREITRRAGMSEKMQNDIFMMGLLHDVGKIGVPDTVINKPGRLDDKEFEIIKSHPATGARILDKIREMPGLAVGAHWHHERYDGKGYPDGLSGEEIPTEARIIAEADAYDAMTSNRSYRDVMPQEKVRGQIENGLGTQFDPVFGGIMITMIDEDTEYRMRER